MNRNDRTVSIMNSVRLFCMDQGFRERALRAGELQLGSIVMYTHFASSQGRIYLERLGERNRKIETRILPVRIVGHDGMQEEVSRLQDCVLRTLREWVEEIRRT